MKLFYKVYLILILVIILILAGNGLISYHREVSLFNDDMEKDALLMGKAIAGGYFIQVRDEGIGMSSEHLKMLDTFIPSPNPSPFNERLCRSY